MEIVLRAFVIFLIPGICQTTDIPTINCSGEEFIRCEPFVLTETQKRFKPVATIPSENVRFIDFYDSKMHTFTSDLCDAFPNLNTISAINLGIKAIDKDALKNCKKINILHLSRNSLTELDSGVFVHNSNLDHIELYSNQISKLDVEFFNNIPQLRYLDLTANQLKKFPVKEMLSLNHLTSLYLEGNQLLDVDVNEMILKFPNLSQITLCHNDLIEKSRQKEILDILIPTKVDVYCKKHQGEIIVFNKQGGTTIPPFFTRPHTTPSAT